MAKWADYLISEVHYEESEDDTKYIAKLKVHEDEGDEVGSESIWTKNEVINKINVGYSFMTIYEKDKTKNKEDKDAWKEGEDVRVFKKKYLRTDANDIEEDNLGELPEF